MSDWLKVLISAIAGMVAGALLEPIKQWISRRIAQFEIVRAIYRELGRTYWIFKYEAPEEGNEAAMEQVVTETYDCYFDKKREALHLIPNHVMVLGAFKMLKRLAREHKEGKITAEAAIHEFTFLIDRFLIMGLIQPKKFFRYSDEYGRWKATAAKEAGRVLGRVRSKEERAKAAPRS
jgi:hypothetical protein